MNNYYIKSFKIPLKDLILEITIIKSQILLNNSIYIQKGHQSIPFL